MLILCIFLHCRADDIQDNSVLRGGIPAAHSIYGFASTLSAINFAISVPLDRVLKLSNPDAVKVYNEMVLEMTWGQAMDIYWRENYICPSVEKYQQMVNRSKSRVKVMGSLNWICALY
jgi:geranylgeranyl diphosphate synthase type 3